MKLLALTAAAGSILGVRRLVRDQRAIDLEGRVVAITGGSRGLGLELARAFAARGARLALQARDLEALERAERELVSTGAEVAVFGCDLRDPRAVETVAEAVLDRFGAVDVLVNNAGVILSGPLERLEEADWEEAMDVHFRAPLRLTRRLAPVLGRRGEGRVVNIASIGGLVAVPHLASYCASKFALVGLSDGLRAELAGAGIRVTTVCPGLMRTGSHLNAWFKGRHRREFALFAILGASPLVSMDAAKAADRIVDACRRGDAFRVLGLSAKALRFVDALAPSVVGEAMARVAPRLPGPGDGPAAAERRRGRDSTSRWAPSRLTRLADRAAVRNNEIARPRPGPSDGGPSGDEVQPRSTPDA